MDSMSDKVLSEDFSSFDTGMFSADVGPLTEYHFLPEAAPKHGWAVAAFSSRGGGTAWHIKEESGRKAMCQTYDARDIHTHPMVSAGSFYWDDYTVRVKFRPEAVGRCGVVFRYHNNRSYYFFGFDHADVVLLRVRHETEFHVPDEHALASKPFSVDTTREYQLVVTVTGSHIEANIDGRMELSADDTTFGAGKIGLLSDGAARFFAVEVSIPAAARKRAGSAETRQRSELEKLRAHYPEPKLWKKIRTPSFGTGRNLRFGDLDGDGRMDIAVGQMHAHGPRDAFSESGCITALNVEGQVLWQHGDPNPAEYVLTNDVAFQIHDLDGDGKNEIIYTKNFEIVVADGSTGEIKMKSPTPKALPPADKFPRILGDCIFFADFRGTGRPADMVIKDRYWHFWVYDEKLSPLWDGACRTGHYPAAMDIDGDGKDELFIGFSLYDHDGSQLWTLDDRINDHADGIAVVNLQDDGTSQPVILYTASDEGVLLVDLRGNILGHHRIGHAQNPAIAKLRRDLPGLQTVSINFWGNQGILHFFDKDGNIYHDAEPLNMGSMCLPVNWTGDGEELFVHNPNPRYGGMFDGWGRPVVSFPDDGHPDMCNAVLDFTGDCRDEIVVWNQHEIWIYTQDDGERSGRLYRPVRNPLYNYSNYQATVSLPGWSE